MSNYIQRYNNNSNVIIIKQIIVLKNKMLNFAED